MRLLVLFMCCLPLTGGADVPALSANDVVSAASRNPGPVAPGEIVILSPANAGPDVLAELQRDREGKLSTLLNDSRVWFDGVPAPMFFAAKGLIGAVVPYEVAGKQSTRIEIEYQGVRSDAVTVPVVPAKPAFFTLDLSGKGPAALLNDSGCCNSARNPAARGSGVGLYATGEGQTNPSGSTGIISAYDKASDYPTPLADVRVTVGGVPAEILWMGEAPHSVAGLFQVNIRIPKNAPTGDAVPLTLMVGGARSPDGVTMAIRSEVRTVLIVERDRVVRDRLQKDLARAGYEALTARDGAEAKTVAGAHPADLIIASLAIPAGEIGEVVEAVRVRRPQVTIAAIAGSSTTEEIRAADLLGAQAILTRAMTSKAVVDRVAELLRPRVVPYVANTAGQ